MPSTFHPTFIRILIHTYSYLDSSIFEPLSSFISSPFICDSLVSCHTVQLSLSHSHPSTRLACGLPRHIIIHYTTYYTYTISLDPSLFCLPHRNICCVCKTVKKRSIVTCCETEKYEREISHTIYIYRFLLPGVAHRRYHHKFLFQPDYSASYL